MGLLSRVRRWRHSVYGFNMYNRREFVRQYASRLPAGSRILDVGAGVGQYRPLFAHCEYKAQDFGRTPETIGKYTPLDFESDILAIPTPDASFDAVLCTEVLEHVPEPILALREMARILRPGGVMILTAPLGCILHQEPFIYYGGYTTYWYERFLPEAGCDVLSIESNEGFYSLYSDLTQWFSSLLHPREWRKQPLGRWPALFALWLMSLPMVQIAGPVGRLLDRWGFGGVGTIGYHVVAAKRGAPPVLAAQGGAAA